MGGGTGFAPCPRRIAARAFPVMAPSPKRRPLGGVQGAAVAGNGNIRDRHCVPLR